MRKRKRAIWSSTTRNSLARVFGVRRNVIIPGNSTFYAVYSIMPYLKEEFEKYKGIHLSDDPKIRHAKRQAIHKKNLRRIAELVEMSVDDLLEEEFREFDSSLIVAEKW